MNDVMSPAADVTPSEAGSWLVMWSRLAERVAGLEARTATQIDGLKRDTEVIRATLHETTNTMQKLVTAEYEHTQGLRLLDSRMTTHTAQLESLLATKNQLEGGWWMVLRISTIGVSFAGAGAVLVGAIFWMMGHLHVQVSP